MIASLPVANLGGNNDKFLRRTSRGLNLEDLITKGLNDPKVSMREDAIEKIVRFGKAAVPLLIKALEKPNRLVRVCAMEVLRKIGKEADKAVPQLRELLKEPDYVIKSNAAYTVRRMGPRAKEAVPELIALIKDPDEIVRLHAIHSLGVIGPSAKEAESAFLLALGRASKLTEPRLVTAIETALRRIKE